mmetsp:Transcript_878/g.1812  ORF Transcript_878/g.1812 Transcript_878/m.1812 type:complete len:358 (+) Transcript_878:76-1149(+)
MNEQMVAFSGSETPQYTTNDMSTQVVALPQAVDAPKQEEVQVPLPALQDTFGMNPNSVGMGALANAAAGQVEEGVKRPGEPIEGGPVKKQKFAVVAADPGVWESLMTQVRGQLRAMSSDECFSRALELQMLARAEVGNRSQHLSNAMDLMATGQSVPEPPIMVKEQYKRNPPNPNISVSPGQRVTKAEREVSKQKPIKTNKAAPVPCMKMTPPLPPRCEVDNAPTVELPAFCQLVNFPTARYYGNCVMCDESEFAIPKQNKGVCNNCDVAIWVVNPSGMNIKWCKGCKNFRKWIDFGVKGYSSKCERCRCQQATRYANQKNKEGTPPPAPIAPPTVPIIIPGVADPAAPSIEPGQLL